jgi:hypothetical protein
MSEPLENLAHACGVQRRYVDGIGHTRVASDESVMAVFRAMGFEVHRPEDASYELERHREEASRRLVDPVAVIWEGRRTLVLVNRSALSAETLHIAIAPAVGPSMEWRIHRDDLRRSKGGRFGFRVP